MRDERLFLDDILAATEDIAEFVDKLRKDEFLANKQVQFAVLAGSAI